MSDVLIVCIPASAAPSRSEQASVGFGLAMAEQLSAACHVVTLGPNASAAAPQFAKLGVAKVLTAEHADLGEPTGEAQAAAIVAVASSGGYRVIAAATSTITRNCFPRAAAKLSAPMATDVLAILGADGDAVRVEKPCFSGNLLAEVELRGPVVLATCRPSSFDPPAEGDSAAPLEAAQLPERLAHPRKIFIQLDKTPLERPELTEADTVVSGGRGTRGAEGFKLLEELADLLGAAVGASRAVVDAGWMPNDFQVGQTGKIIAPKLYIGCGVSGAIQHLAGMRNSKVIVAINKDVNAPIFEVADYGLVADLFEAVPQLTAAIQAQRESAGAA